MKHIDLHIHSSNSDGIYTKEELSKIFSTKREAFFSITDHNYLTDTFVRKEKRTIWIPGIEVSTQIKGVSVHLTGYSSKPHLSKELKKSLSDIRVGYSQRAQKQHEQLKKEGFELPPLSKFRRKNLPPPVYTYDIAKVLINELGVKDEKAVISWCKVNGNKLFVEEENFMPDTINIIKELHDSGFIVFWAHPGTRFLRNEKERKLFETTLELFTDNGLDGIEAFYINHDKKQISEFIEYGKRKNLLFSCGSDFHGEGRAGNKYFPRSYRYLKKTLEAIGVK